MNDHSASRIEQAIPDRMATPLTANDVQTAWRDRYTGVSANGVTDHELEDIRRGTVLGGEHVVHHSICRHLKFT